ncbi:MAG: efflux RND transporter permease subunit [Gammaproteobacteria bacterium]|nr:efflux RND transporter permease subunit [Gammaproteobacteria bacterium]
MHGMIGWFARNGVAANLLMVVILFLGLNALLERIPLEIFPEFERDVITVQMNYRGATPAEVEEGVVIRIEEAIEDLQGIERIVSNANEGTGQLRIELDRNTAPRDMLDDVKNRVDAISTFPDDAERPSYSVLQFRRNVISVVAAGELPESDLRRLGERIRDDLLALPGITQVELQAVRDYEISIEVSEDSLDRYGLTFDAIVEAVQRSSVDLPAGSIKSDGGEILLRTKGQAYTKRDFERIVVRTRIDGTRLTLGEIARVMDGFEEDPLYAEFNGKPAVLMEVYRTGDQSAIATGKSVREYVETQRPAMPPGVELAYWRDQSRIVELRLNTLVESAMLGGLLIFLLLALFLRFSVAVWVCIGIPVSFMGALALMPVLGVTINLISLFAFILVLGIVVDDAIVTGENIYSHLRRGDDPLEGAISGTREIAVPVTFGVLTTVAAFAPLLMIEGARGDIFAQIPLVVIPVLLFSLVESKLILPAHMKHVRAREARENILVQLQQRVADGLERLVRGIYQPVLTGALKRRYLTLALFVGVSFIILSFVISGRYGFTFFPRVESETAQVSLEMPVGTAVETTAGHIHRIAGIARAMREEYRDPRTGESVIRNVMVSIGWAGGGAPSSGQPHIGQVSLELEPPETRKVDVRTNALVQELRTRVGIIPGARELTYRAELGRGGAPIDIQLEGSDFSTLEEVADRLRERLATYPGVFDIQDSLDEGKPEIQLTIKPEAELLGLSAGDLGRQVRQAFFGAEAQRIQRGREDVRVMVRYPEDERSSPASLGTMGIRTGTGARVPFTNVADAELGIGFATIRRVDQQRTVNVQADIDKARGNLNTVVADLIPYLDEILRDFPGVRYSQEGELREQRESFQSLNIGATFVLFVIYSLLAIPFRSYIQPLIVMAAIPFSLVGAVAGHMIMGMNLSIMSIMGMLALAGVVVNDSLVLVDWVNRRRREGMVLADAVRSAGAARFRAILLTSLTTFAGLVPLIFEQSTQAQFLIPMAVSLGFGILFATFVSLLLVPVAYLLLEDLKRVGGRLAGTAPRHAQ